MEETFRPAQAADLPFLLKMLYEAIFWNPDVERLPPEEILAVPEIERIFAGWKTRSGDYAIILENAGQYPVGAVWYRFWTFENHSYGFLDPDTPELGIALLPECRGRGFGERLMRKILAHARVAGIRRMSLSVEAANFARHLYEKLGFVKVEEVGNSWTMVCDLTPFTPESTERDTYANKSGD